MNSEEVEVIDAKGQTVIPGFIDTHNHLLAYGITQGQVDCSTPLNKDIDDILERIASKVSETIKGKWIQGTGYDDTLLLEKRHPTRAELDSVAPDHPVLLMHISGHIGVANSVALKLAGVTEDTPDPSGAHYGRNEQGLLNGVLEELAAIGSVNRMIPGYTVDELVAFIAKGAEEYVAQGITTNTDAAVGIFEDHSDYEAHLLAAKSGANPMRTRLMIMDHLLGEGGRYSNHSAEALDKEIQDGSNGRARLDSAKLFQDGSIQGLTGALRKPYYQNPQITGELIHEQSAFNEEVLDFHRRGFRIATHGNGDRAIGSILSAYKYAIATYPRTDHRHRIEHVQTATPEDLAQMNRLAVAGSVFINHVYFWGERHAHLFLGPERAAHISPLAEMKAREILFTLHSDCPVTPISPLFSIWAAVNRLTTEGNVLGSTERIDVLTALKSMTIYGAKLNFTEKESGSIEIGKHADFAILNQNPTEIDPNEIKDINIQKTIIAGKVVFERS